MKLILIKNNTGKVRRLRYVKGAPVIPVTGWCGPYEYPTHPGLRDIIEKELSQGLIEVRVPASERPELAEEPEPEVVHAPEPAQEPISAPIPEPTQEPVVEDSPAEEEPAADEVVAEEEAKPAKKRRGRRKKSED